MDDSIDEIELPNFGFINTNKLKNLDYFIIQDDFDSFSEFSKYYSQNSQQSRCSASWNKLSISCLCVDCQKGGNSCNCVKCFLEGPHKHHNCHIHLSSSGNCDCGDFSSWEQSGMCKSHRPNNDSNKNNQKFEYDDNEDDYFISNVASIPNSPLPSELKKRLLLSFNEVKRDIEKMIENENFQYFEECCRWYLKFCQLGDEISDLVERAVNDIDLIKNVLLNAHNLNKQKVSSFFLLAGSLTNHCTFSDNFLSAAVQVIPGLLDRMRESSNVPFRIYNDLPTVGMSTVFQFTYQYICNYPVESLTKQNKFDWIQFLLDINDRFIDFIISEFSSKVFYNYNYAFRILQSFKFILRVIFRIESEKPKMKRFFIQISKSIEKIEGFSHSNLNELVQNYDIWDYMYFLVKLPHKMLKKMPYFVPEVVDIFVWHLLNDQYKDNRDRLNGYSMATMLHQLFVSNMLLFNKKNENETEKFDEDDFFCICYEGQNPKETFDFYINLNLKRQQLNNVDINEIYLKAIELPMNSISTHFLINFDQLQLQGPHVIINNITRLHGGRNYIAYVLPKLISLVQMIFSFTEKDQKDKMIKFIADSFGAFDSSFNLESRKMRDFSFVFFMSTIILDRDCINDDIISICLKNLMTAMKLENINVNDIQEIVSPCKISNEKFQQKLKSMKIETDWNLIIPYSFNICHLYSRIIPEIIGRTEDLLLPFPEFVDSKSELLLNLREVFECKFLFASIFTLIYEYNNDQVMIQYALNLFITFVQNSMEFNKDDEQLIKTIIEARTIDDFVANIPTNNFKLFANMNVKFKGNTGISLLHLIENLGVIGVSALRQVGLADITVKKSKKKLEKMKQKIIKNFQKNNEKFSSLINHQSHDCCSICHQSICPKGDNENDNENDNGENSILFIPIFFFDSVSTDFYDDFARGKIDPNKDDMLYEKREYIRKLVKHNYVHKECFEMRENYNGDFFLMPKIDQFPLNFGKLNDYSSLEYQIITKITNFLYDSHLCQKAPQILSQMILSLDYRSRLNLEILEDSSVISLYSNLFRNCIFSYSFSVSFSDSLNEIEDVIFDCLEMVASNEQSENEEYLKIIQIREKEKIGKISLIQFLFSKIVQSHQSKSKHPDEYLRRCYLIEKFYLCDKTDVNDGFIDWDFYLSYRYLYSHFYHQKLEEKFEFNELPVYRGLENLPDYFLELFYPPFNAPSISIENKYCICLFSGAVIKDTFSSTTSFGLPFTVVLNLYGRSISSISIVVNERYSTSSSLGNWSIYVDKNGYSDTGLRRGSNLVLSKEKYYKLIDAFMSGDILDPYFFK